MGDPTDNTLRTTGHTENGPQVEAPLAEGAASERQSGSVGDSESSTADVAASVSGARTAFARALRSRGTGSVDAFLAHLRDVVPDPAADVGGDFEDGLRGMIEACIGYGLAAFERGGVASLSLPAAVSTHARRSATAGVSLEVALARCSVGFMFARRGLLRVLHEMDLPTEEKQMLLLETSDAIGTLLGMVQMEVVEAHRGRIVGGARSREQRRSEIVERLLAGAQPTPDDLADIGYELDAWHVAVVTLGPDAKKTASSLQARFGCQMLSILRTPEEVHAWLGAGRKLQFDDIAQAAGSRSDREERLAVGETARGLEGWRLTRRQAKIAATIGHLRGQPLTRYRDVALEAAALQDEALGDALIARCLAPLEDAHGGGEVRRRVLRAVFDAEYTKSSAAHALDVDRDTVRRHVAEIEERLGSPLPRLHAEIDIALRVEELRKLRDQGGDHSTERTES